MLDSLKKRFILIVMVLAGLVLVGSLGLSLYSTWRGQQQLINDSLQRGVEGRLNSVPTIGAKVDRVGEPTTNMLAIAVDVSSTGIVLETSETPAYVDAEILRAVIRDALESGRSHGHSDEHHVSWMREETAEGYRIALVDTTAGDQAMSILFTRYLMIATGSLVALYLVSRHLATMALRPVAEAWDRQRRFIADASHELKTPLAVILANTEILRKDQALSADERGWVDSTASEAKQMKALVNDLLQLARTDESVAGSAAPLATQDVDFSDLVETTAMEFDAVAFEHGCTIDSAVDEGIHVSGDPDWLGRMVRILIDNACKYAAKDSVVTVSLGREGHGCRLKVNNMGEPIPAADLPHVFERFYRSDTARERTGSGGGFGLGLAIAKGIVDSHGGTIEVTSSEQGGTTFSVVL